MELTTQTETLPEETNAYRPALMADVPIATNVWREGVEEFACRWVKFEDLNRDLMASMITSLNEIEHGLTSRQKLDFFRFLHGHVDDLSCKVMKYLEDEAAKMDDDVVFFLEDLQQAPNDQMQPN